MDWLGALDRDLGTVFPDILRKQDEVYVCISWKERGGERMATMDGTEAAMDFEEAYSASELRDIHVRQQEGEQRYDIVLEAGLTAAETYLEQRDLPSPDRQDIDTGVETLRIRYTNDIHDT